MDFSEIAYEVDDGIATVTLDRPEKMNAGTATMIVELVKAFDLVDADDAVRALIITGRGKAFCAGADLSAGAATFDYAKHAAEREASPPAEAPPKVFRDGAGVVTMRMFELTKPVIGAINGVAVGMGATIPLAMDVRLASTSARFGYVFARRGIVPEGASSWFLPRIVGISRALEWCYSGRIFGAEEALEAGLVRSLHEPDELLPAARELASRMTESSAPVSVALTRALLWRMLAATHPMEAHRADSRAVMATGSSPDAAEGVMSFLEKRPPAFPGRVSDGLPDVFSG
jgi:enoyl-CoA hydratase/carnithine racemase